MNDERQEQEIILESKDMSGTVDEKKKFPVKKVLLVILIISLAAGMMCGGLYLKEVSGFRERLETTEVTDDKGNLVSIPYPVTIGKTKVSLDEFLYYSKIAMMNDPELAGDDKALRKEALKAIKYFIALEEIAKDYDVTLSHNELLDVAENIQEEKTIIGSEEGYQEALKAMGLTDYLYHKFRAMDLMSQKLSDKLFNEKGKYGKKAANLSNEEKASFYRETLKKLSDEKVKKMKVSYDKNYELITASTIHLLSGNNRL